MLNCIAIDDEPLAHIILENYLKKIPFINLKQTFTSVDDAIKYCDYNLVDLIFLDIQMPLINGVDFCKAHCKDKMVIFITAFENYAVQGFELNAIDYLLKPIDENRFKIAVTKAKDYYNYKNNLAVGPKKTFLFVRSKYTLIKIEFKDIEYIETLDDYLKINLIGQSPVVTKMNLKTILSSLDENLFIRVHRSYVINLSKITSIRGKLINISDVEIPIGSSFDKEFTEKLALLNA
jgi:DNA-binding LytR/AlgR family response regulator